MRNREVRIVCYVDDATLIADNEDDFQRLLFRFHNAFKQFGLKISKSKTKALTISKEPLSCKLEHQGQVTEQVISFNYLVVTITSSRIMAREAIHQANKAAKVSAYLNKTIRLNTFLRKV